MELLEASVQVLVESLTERADLRESADALAHEILEVARMVDTDAQGRAVEKLADSLDKVQVADRGRLLLVLGALVERGAPIGKAGERVLDELAGTLHGARRFASWCEDAAEKEGSETITPAIEAQVAKEHPEEAARWKLLDPIARAMVSLLGRDHELRERASARPRLEANLQILRHVHPTAEQLAQLMLPPATEGGGEEPPPSVH